MIPDIDSISLVINRNVYFGHHWYSHHAFTHSVVGVLLLNLTCMLLFQPKILWKVFNKDASFKAYTTTYIILVMGALIHLPCDMVTLPGSWEGIPLWAPFSWSRYGGWSYIPWKDYFLIYLSLGTYAVVSLIWMTEHLLQKRTLILPLLCMLILFGSSYHVFSSKFVNYHQWEEEQKQLIGNELFIFAQRVESKVAYLWTMQPLWQ